LELLLCTFWYCTIATPSKDNLLVFRARKQLGGVSGGELFSLSKSKLEQCCGKDEGHRLDSQLHVQRSISGVSAILVLIACFCFGCWIGVCLTRAINMSNNKIKTTLNVIKMETCKIHTNEGTQLKNIDGKLITNQQSIADSFNNYFLTVADKITSNTKNDKTSLNCNNSIHYLHKNFQLPCSNMKLKYYNTHTEIKKIIK